MKYAISKPRYSNAEGTMIDVEWDHPVHGVIPFTAVDVSSDPLYSNEPEYMSEIWDGLVAGEYGEIVPFEQNEE